MSTDDAGTAPPDACLNCGAPFGPARPHFCPACGQETNVKPPRLGELLQQFGGAYLSTEGALWRTLKLLLLKPGELTRQYLAGRRKHYVLPVRLYLTISVVVLLLVRLAPSTIADAALAEGVGPRAGELAITLGPVQVRMTKGKFQCGLPDWLCGRLRRHFDGDAAGLQGQALELQQRFLSNVGATMFVIVPTLAAMLMLAYRNRRLRYTEHLVFALHLQSFAFIMLLATLPQQEILSTVAGVATLAYTWVAVKRVYGGRALPRALRFVMLCMTYLTVLSAAMTALALALLAL
jgi:hypothetical protein